MTDALGVVAKTGSDHMQLKSFAFSELWGTDRHWKVEKFGINKRNLFVGRNAAGKSRILNCIHALAKVLKSPSESYPTGHWQVEFTFEKSILYYELVIHERKISRERLLVDGAMKLERRADGTGVIWNDQVSSHLKFGLSSQQVAAFYKRDSEQHKFLDLLGDWARNERHYPFSSELGKRTIFAARSASDPEPEEIEFSTEADRTTELYARGFHRFGEQFDKAILRDMKAVGYDCESIHAVTGPDLFDQMPPALRDRVPVLLELKERDLPAPTRQFEMSLGMYRALALIIHFNFCRLSKTQSTVLIDDIGEGLDFERSSSLIKTIMKRATSSKIQVLMSSNDRFVMNEVDLSDWKMVDRSANIVKVLDENILGERIERFKRIGLSNFDFFSRELVN